MSMADVVCVLLLVLLADLANYSGGVDATQPAMTTALQGGWLHKLTVYSETLTSQFIKVLLGMSAINSKHMLICCLIFCLGPPSEYSVRFKVVLVPTE